MLQLRDQYDRTPGHCRLCRSAETPVIDTGNAYDSDGFGGALYVCFNCGTEIAQIVGFISPILYEKQVEELTKTVALLNKEEEKSEMLQAALDAAKVLSKVDQSGVRQQRPRKGRTPNA